MRKAVVLLIGILLLGGMIGMVSAAVEGGVFKIWDTGYAWNSTVDYDITNEEFSIQWEAIINESKISNDFFNVTIMQVNLSNGGYGKMWIVHDPSQTTVIIHYKVHNPPNNPFNAGDTEGSYDTGIDITDFFGTDGTVNNHTYRIVVNYAPIGSVPIAPIYFYFDGKDIGSGSTVGFMGSTLYVTSVGVYITQEPLSGGGQVYLDNIQGTGINGILDFTDSADANYFDKTYNASWASAVPFFSNAALALLLALAAVWFFKRK